jgi:hypothetical protein
MVKRSCQAEFYLQLLPWQQGFGGIFAFLDKTFQ